MSNGAETTDGEISLRTRLAAETEQLGRLFGEELRAGDRVACTGELGAGKTVFARGLARGLGVPDDVPVRSPTYVLHRRYEEGRLPLNHVDAYRLQGPQDWQDLDPELLAGPEAVTLVEWAERIEPVFEPTVRVAIEAVGMEERRFRITCSNRPELIEKLKEFRSPE